MRRRGPFPFGRTVQAAIVSMGLSAMAAAAMAQDASDLPAPAATAAMQEAFEPYAACAMDHVKSLADMPKAARFSSVEARIRKRCGSHLARARVDIAMSGRPVAEADAAFRALYARARPALRAAYEASGPRSSGTRDLASASSRRAGSSDVAPAREDQAAIPSAGPSLDEDAELTEPTPPVAAPARPLPSPSKPRVDPKRQVAAKGRLAGESRASPAGPGVSTVSKTAPSTDPVDQTKANIVAAAAARGVSSEAAPPPAVDRRAILTP